MQLIRPEYPKLRGLMMERGVDQDDLQRLLRRSPAYVSRRMCRKDDFTLSEAYTILSFLGVPAIELAVYFPEERETPIKRNQPERT